MIKLAKTVDEYHKLEQTPYQKFVYMISSPQTLYSNSDDKMTYVFEPGSGEVQFFINNTPVSKTNYYKQR